MSQDDVFLALGSNLGDRLRNLESALDALRARLRITAVSGIYETEPMGFADQSPFLNLVCRASTGLSPEELHEFTLGTEKLLGRQPTFRNGPRTIDIDILFYGSRCISSERLSIPHPRIPERAFVLIPLAEIAPDFQHPGLHKTVRELLAEVADSHWVHPMNGGSHVPTVR